MAPKILIADDDPETLRLVSLMLQKQGYQIITASNGVQAIGLARVEKPDLMIVDVMMPDLDGFEVVRQLRKNQDIAATPILMFTAKTQVEDKVEGYEAGADDYLTKPVHPAELQARIRSLLTRSQTRAAASTPSAPRGYVIGVLGAKGGIGTSTLAINLAAGYQKYEKDGALAAELKPGQGTWALELGFNQIDGICDLLRMKPSEISLSLMEKYIMKSNFGLRLLLASNQMKDVELSTATAQMDAIIQQLPYTAPFVVIDIGTAYMPGIENVLSICNELVLLTEPGASSVQRSRILIGELEEKGFGKTKPLSLVIYSRVRSDLQLSHQQIQEAIGINASIVIPPSPEQAYQASLRFMPLTLVKTDGLVTQQYMRLLEQVVDRMHAR